MRKYLPALLASSLLLISCHENFADRCRREALEYTEKQCPHPVDEMIDMDSMTFVSGDAMGFAYFYTIHGVADNDSLMTDEVVDMFRTRLSDRIRTDISLKPYKEKQFVFSYTYFSRNTGRELLSITLTPEDYR